MSKELVIRIVIPDGVSVDVEQAAAGTSSPAAAAAPSGGSCPIHHKAFKQNKYGKWICATPVAKDDNGNVLEWCSQKP